MRRRSFVVPASKLNYEDTHAAPGCQADTQDHTSDRYGVIVIREGKIVEVEPHPEMSQEASSEQGHD